MRLFPSLIAPLSGRMSPSEALAPVVFTVQELLAFNEDQLVQFLNDCRTPRNDFDISRLLGVDGLSKGQQGEFGERLSAAAEKAGPFNSDLLSSLLGILAGHDSAGDTPSSSRSRQVRSPTSSPPLEGNSRYEVFCHDELVKAGGRPMASFELFLDTLKDAEATREILGPWLGDTDSGSGDMPPAFSVQLEDWELFQHRWQWDNRGKYAGDEGFAAFLESRRKRYLHKGESEIVSDASFEETARQIWRFEERHLELSGTEGFAAYTQAVEKRLASHQFTQPFRLAKDPRQQDQRTTWVEYLGYIYWRRDRYAAAMRAAEPQYRQAWDELQHFNTSPPSTISTTIGALDEEMDAARAQLETTRQQIHKFIKDTQTYRRWETAVHRQELRAQWVLEQLSLIGAASSAENKASKSSSSVNSGKKRKVRDDHEPRQQPKRRRQEVGHSGSTLDPEPGTGKGSDITMPNETAATLTTTGSGPRRSQRLRADVAPEEAFSSQLQSERRQVPKILQRQSRTQEETLDSTTTRTLRTRKRKLKM